MIYNIILVKCEDCKFWDKRGQPFHDDIYGMCALIYEGIISVEKKAIAYVSDCNNGDYVHHLHTRYDFGCSLAQQKDHLTQRAADLSGTTNKGKSKHHGPQGGSSLTLD